MSDTIMVTIAPEPDRVRVLATTPTHDVLKAVLGPARAAHPRAAATLLEGLSLWHQRPLSRPYPPGTGYFLNQTAVLSHTVPLVTDRAS